MKFIGIDTTIRLFNINKVFDSQNIEVATTLLEITPAGEEFDLEVLSCVQYKVEPFETRFLIEVESLDNPLLLGEKILIYLNGDFPNEAFIQSVGKSNRYKLLLTSDTEAVLGTYKYALERDILTTSDDIGAGIYYSQSGEFLFIGKGFDLSKAVNVRDLKMLKPSMKDQLEDWQISNLIHLAYNSVMKDLSSYENFFAEKYSFIDTDDIISLIETRAIGIFEEGLGNDNNKYFLRKYIAELSAYKPRLKVSESGVETVQYRRIRF